MAKRVTLGSFYDKVAYPSRGDQVWTYLRTDRGAVKTVKGIVQDVETNNFQGGNAYITVLTEDGKMFLPSSVLFDHKPRLVAVTDSFGECHVWR